MTITNTNNGTETVLALEGRLDTTTAPQLEAELAGVYEGTDMLVFNFAKLEYVSSAGLRVLLAAQKQMNKQGTMKLKNVNGDVQEVFDITGFSDILTIE